MLRKFSLHRNLRRLGQSHSRRHLGRKTSNLRRKSLRRLVKLHRLLEISPLNLEQYHPLPLGL